MKRLQAELKGKAQVERENRDIYMEQIKLKAQEQRQTILESIKYHESIHSFSFFIAKFNCFIFQELLVMY